MSPKRARQASPLQIAVIFFVDFRECTLAFYLPNRIQSDQSFRAHHDAPLRVLQQTGAEMAADPIVVAVDGGQSSTLALAATLNGEIIGVGWGGESNHIDEPGGVERLNNALNFSITGALTSAGRDAA